MNRLLAVDVNSFYHLRKDLYSIPHGRETARIQVNTALRIGLRIYQSQGRSASLRKND